MNRLKIWFYVAIVFFISASLFVSCIDEESFADGSNVSLSFSMDTLSFDTVFTQMGSITKQVLIYNKEDKPVKINSVRLGGGSASYFRLNVDGDTALVAHDVEIGAKDSIFIFVRVTINPVNQNNPLLISDSIIIAFNSKYQCIQLQAYGQDAYYHIPTDTLPVWVVNNPKPMPFSLAQNADGVVRSGNILQMKANKPHVIIGTFAVDSSFTLEIESGAKLYFANGGSLLVYTYGTLKAHGGLNDPVVFEGVRREASYANTAGQWNGIILWVGSRNNELDYCIIKNAVTGIEIDSCVTANPTLKLKNTRIENMTFAGIFSQGGHVESENTIVQNCGSYCVALDVGGEYKFTHCTFENSWSGQQLSKSALYMKNYHAANGVIYPRPITSAQFLNTIIYGSKQDEILIDKYEESSILNYTFVNCLIKSATLNGQDANITSSVFNSDPLFVNILERDLHVLPGSPAIGGGDATISYTVPYDLEGNWRGNPPTIGALEFVP
ncbi:MAG: hypothetical protein LBR17_06650 [Bacteroidales bacterium]|jgi:hypothetical protein|nr:hypothetical protein [Bacteroidales bacterium]